MTQMRRLVSRGGGGGGTLIFSHIRRLGPFFGFKKFQYFFGFSEKWIFFLGMKILWIFFRGHHKIWLVWGSFLCNLWSFLRSRYRIGIIFWVANISNIFLGFLKSLIFFFGLTVDAGSEPTYTEKNRVPPWGWSAPFFIINPKEQGFSRRGPFIL